MIDERNDRVNKKTISVTYLRVKVNFNTKIIIRKLEIKLKIAKLILIF